MSYSRVKKETTGKQRLGLMIHKKFRRNRRMRLHDKETFICKSTIITTLNAIIKR